MSPRYARRSWADRSCPRVVDVAPGLVHESGPTRSRGWSPERVALLAHWSADPVPTRSVVDLLVELDAAGFETVVVSAAEAAGPLGRTCTWAPGDPRMPDSTSVLRRANVGHDFGSWAAALQAHPGIAGAARVLVVNDSLVGPFGPLDDVLSDFESCGSPVWGITSSSQYRPHLQSFFLGFREGILATAEVAAFWADVRVERRKAKVVRYGELGLADVLEEAGISWGAMHTPGPTSGPNPMIQNWQELLRSGLPFVKREVVDSPLAGAPDRASIARAVEATFGQDLAEWLPPVSSSTAQRRSLSRQLQESVDLHGILGAAARAVSHGARRPSRPHAEAPAGHPTAPQPDGGGRVL